MSPTSIFQSRTRLLRLEPVITWKRTGSLHFQSRLLEGYPAATCWHRQLEAGLVATI